MPKWLIRPFPTRVRSGAVGCVGAAAFVALTFLAACDQPPPTATPTPFILPPPAPAPTVPPSGSSIVTQVGLILNEPGAFGGYTLFGTRSEKVYLIDNNGQMVHQWSHRGKAVRLLENGNLMLINAPENRIKEIGVDSDIVWEYQYDRARGSLHHDFAKLPNGNALLLVSGEKSREEVIASGGNPELIQDGGIVYDYLVEIEPSNPSGGRVVWEWSLWDHIVQDFDPEKPGFGSPSERPELVHLNGLLPNFPDAHLYSANDWTHTNAIDYNAELDQILLCARNHSEVWIIDHSATREEAAGHSGGNAGKGGDLLHRWGNPRRYNSGTAEDQLLFWPHGCRWIRQGLPGAGNIIVFNNGDEFQGDRIWYSSVMEFTPPIQGYRYRKNPGEAHIPSGPAWFYAADDPADFWAARFGSVQRLPNGNTMISDGVHGTIFEVTPEGKTVWKYVNPVTPDGPLRQGDPIRLHYQAEYTRWDNAFQRATRYPPDYPGLRGLDLTPKGTIEGPRREQETAGRAAYSDSG